MSVYDVSYPHDLRIRFNKPSVTAEEIDGFLADPGITEDAKRLLLADVEPQGYKTKGDPSAI